MPNRSSDKAGSAYAPAPAVSHSAFPTTPAAQQASPEVCDPTYYRVLGRRSWNRLHAQIRRRFSRAPTPGNRIIYQGRIDIRHSTVGWLFAQLGRLLGSPLVRHQGDNIPLAVVLSPDSNRAGITWLRQYHFPDKGLSEIRSTKRLDGNGQLEEYLGCGFSMPLRIYESSGNLHFISDGYFLTLGPLRIRLPTWLTPGRTHVSHEQIHGRRFRFSIRVTHPLFGATLFQTGVFQD